SRMSGLERARSVRSRRSTAYWVGVSRAAHWSLLRTSLPITAGPPLVAELVAGIHARVGAAARWLRNVRLSIVGLPQRSSRVRRNFSSRPLARDRQPFVGRVGIMVAGRTGRP